MAGREETLLDFLTPNPVIVDGDTSLDEAQRLLERYGFRHLPVVECNRVVGILSDRDLRLATSLLPVAARGASGEAHEPGRVGQIMRTRVHVLPPDTSPDRAALDLVERGIGALPVVEDDVLVGIVTETDFLRAFLELCRRSTCDDLASNHMHAGFATVPPETLVEEALERMDARVGHLGVAHDGPLVGILSERDLLLGLARARIRDEQAQAAGRLETGSLPVGELMTRNVLSIRPDTRLSRAVETMIAYRFSALPVIEDGRPVGCLTQRDVLQYYAHVV